MMKRNKIIALFMALLFAVSSAGCVDTPDVKDTTASAPETSEGGQTSDDTTSSPEASYPSAEDNYAGTPAYTVDGDNIIVDGVSYPNNNNLNCGPLLAVDDLDRALSTAEQTKGYITDGKNVGLFYFLWLGEHGDSDRVFDNTKIIAEGGAAALKPSYSGWGGVGAMHFWGEPLYGYYYSKDKWVMRKHIEELTAANVDFLYIDVTNGYTYTPNAKALMEVMQDFINDGYNPPKIVFYTHSNSSGTVKELYNNIYSQNYNPDTWMMLDGKPLIIAYESECKSKLSNEIYEFFSYREAQWPNEAQKRNGWPWMDFNYPQRVFKNASGEKEAISVSVAQHSGTVCFSDSAFYGDRSNRGRSYHDKANDESENSTLYGYNFQEQWDRAIKADVPYVLVTGWNEWVAQRQDPNMGGRGNKVNFVDTASMEYSRDIEPMAGGYFDNYYMQLIENIRAYKGTAPTLVQDTRKAIDLSGGFEQWNDILVTYSDCSGDAVKRRAKAFGNSVITSDTGVNDIIASKVVYDTKYIYFYVKVADTDGAVISPFTADCSWMQLFINSDMNQSGFYGYDYIVNYQAKDATTTTLGKCTSTDGTYAFELVEEINYTVSGCEMMIRVPLESLGITDYSKIMFTFKWADANTSITTMEQMYTDGDCAPLGRLNYVFQNYK